jgi:hypothetical protein
MNRSELVELFTLRNRAWKTGLLSGSAHSSSTPPPPVQQDVVGLGLDVVVEKVPLRQPLEVAAEAPLEEGVRKRLLVRSCPAKALEDPPRQHLVEVQVGRARGLR